MCDARDTFFGGVQFKLADWTMDSVISVIRLFGSECGVETLLKVCLGLNKDVVGHGVSGLRVWSAWLAGHSSQLLQGH